MLADNYFKENTNSRIYESLKKKLLTIFHISKCEKHTIQQVNGLKNNVRTPETHFPPHSRTQLQASWL